MLYRISPGLGVLCLSLAIVNGVFFALTGNPLNLVAAIFTGTVGVINCIQAITMR